MPFTPSHAVVALPFLRTPLIPSAIAIGAMTPDLPLFLRGIGVSYAFTHAFANIAWTGLIALGLFLLWRVVLRPAAAELAPAWLADRLPAAWETTPAAAAAEAVGTGARRLHPLLLAGSLLLGIASHIAWDLFTHDGRAGTVWLPALDAMWGPAPGYRWLQHGSSVLGLILLAGCGIVWLRRSRAHARKGRMLPDWVRAGWWLSLPAALSIAMVVGRLIHGPITPDFTVQHLAYRALPPACAIWGLLTIALCAAVAVGRGRR